MQEDRNSVYFAIFCQLIYSFCSSDKAQLASELIEPFKHAKRAFTDLLSTDNKKAILRPLQIPQSVKHVLVNSDPNTYTAIYPDIQPSQPSSAPTTNQPPTTYQPQPTQPTIRTYFQPAQSSLPQPSVSTIRTSSSRPKRAKYVPKSPPRRRRMILRDESDDEDEQVQVQAL